MTNAVIVDAARTAAGRGKPGGALFDDPAAREFSWPEQDPVSAAEESAYLTEIVLPVDGGLSM